MAALSIRGLDDQVKDKLRIRAAQHGRSMEAEIRAILTSAVVEEPPQSDLFRTLTERFTRLGGLDDLDLPARNTPPRGPDLLQ